MRACSVRLTPSARAWHKTAKLVRTCPLDTGVGVLYTVCMLEKRTTQGAQRASKTAPATYALSCIDRHGSSPSLHVQRATLACSAKQYNSTALDTGGKMPATCNSCFA